MKTRMVTVFVAILGILIPSIAFSKQQDMLIAFLEQYGSTSAEAKRYIYYRIVSQEECLGFLQNI
jgi:hypothetical protein